ncbi:MAG: type III pantothenate kinase, partial [Candidatus Omnitrophica bacterium]|nr:type III pantothenate kinase [Candidatus Omnitrophota bacterium]
MFLAIDIGNTNINFGLFHNNRLLRRIDITVRDYNFKKLKEKLRKVNIESSIICSVVPNITSILLKDLSCIINKPLIVGKDLNVPIKNLYRYPQKLGQDRLINAYAGMMLYGAPCIIIDIGTALTFDIVSKDRCYLGGMILPGLKVSLNTLAKNTALLPQLSLKRPKEFIGRNTENSILSGLIYGFSALIDGIIEKIKKYLRYDLY